MTKIEDGTGKGFQTKVNSDNQLEVHAVSDPTISFATDEGNAYSFVSRFASVAGDEVISIKNSDADKNLHIDSLSIESQQDTPWILFEVTSGTAGGTTITPANLNLGSSKTAEGTFFGNASVTGTLTGTDMFYFHTLANTHNEIPLQGSLLIPNGKEIALTCLSGGSVNVTVTAFYEED